MATGMTGRAAAAATYTTTGLHQTEACMSGTQHSAPPRFRLCPSSNFLGTTTRVEPPKEEPKLPSLFWGFTEDAEVWNSRAAMIGIFGIIAVEAIINKGILQLLGIEVGKGLDLPL
ncbi:hypothetical protein BDL97_07G006800 [Sphagnum fallax]|nr:hypothetical protein BDL97_07G006800 [Sphagnum fallax]